MGLEISTTAKEGIKKEAGLCSVTIIPQQWRECCPEKNGNKRDHANVHQRVCLVNLESLNIHFIDQKLSQAERLLRLNEVAIWQMQILLANETSLMLGDNSND